MNRAAPTLYTIGEVAAILGLSPHTIRAWERRHGLVQPVRTASRQRRYRAEDVDLLRNVKREMDLNGLSLRVAFQAATGAVKTELPTSRTRRLQSPRYLEVPEEATVWHAVSDVLPELILIVDANGSIVDSNIAVARAFGGVRQRFAGRDFTELVDDNDRSKARLLFGPELRSVSSWELNMATRQGPRLYSFRTWQVRQAGRPLLAAVGTEMYHDETETQMVPYEVPQEARAQHPHSNPTARVLDRLVDRLPFGVAVTTVGPRPRVVYSNRRIIETLGVPFRTLTGRTLDEILPIRDVIDAVHEVVETRSARRRTGVRIESRGVVLNVAIRPLYSSQSKVTSVLLVVEDVTSDTHPDERLERLVTDDRLRNATTATELMGAALDDLAELSPGSEFAIQLFRQQTANATGTVMASAGSWQLARDRAAKKMVTRILDRVGATVSEVSVTARLGTARHRVTAVPVFAQSERGRRVHLGTVVWRRPSDDRLPAEERRAIDLFVAHFGLAAQLLRLRSVAARSSAFLDSAAAAAAIVRESREVGRDLAVRFLERLAAAIRADACVLLRVERDDMIVEAAHTPRGFKIEPGRRIPQRGQFVSQSVRTREPIATARVQQALRAIGSQYERGFSTMRHGLSVPLVLDGDVVGAIVLLRTVASPFSAEDVALVQTLSSVAMLAIGLKTWRQRVWPTRAISPGALSRRQQSKTRPEGSRVQKPIASTATRANRAASSSGS
jgi:PAS domain S-box-containing protein